MKEKIHHIKTGGTIEGVVPEYKEIQEMSGIFGDTVNFGKYLEKSLKMLAEYSETGVCYKDSREINQEDRAAVAAAIEQKYKDGISKFLITHGTYTMPEMGTYLEEHLKDVTKQNVQVIITGSFYPWSLIGSDAPINIGVAIGILLNTHEPQIKLCMHGKLFDPRKVKKDVDNLIFEE